MGNSIAGKLLRDWQEALSETAHPDLDRSPNPALVRRLMRRPIQGPGVLEPVPELASLSSAVSASFAWSVVHEHRTQIIQVAAKHHIQPELLAGVVWVEMFGGGLVGWSSESQQLSMFKYKFAGKGDFGITKFNQRGSVLPKLPKGPLRTGLSAVGLGWAGSYLAGVHQRALHATSYEADIHAQLENSAGLLTTLARKWYPGRWDHLGPGEMSIVLTEYNRAETAPHPHPAPSPYGERFLEAYRSIRTALYGTPARGG